MVLTPAALALKVSLARTPEPESGVGGSEIENLGDFYHKVWSHGPAGVEIPLEIVRDGRAIGLRVRSADRSTFLKRPRLQ